MVLWESFLFTWTEDIFNLRSGDSCVPFPFVQSKRVGLVTQMCYWSVAAFFLPSLSFCFLFRTCYEEMLKE